MKLSRHDGGSDLHFGGPMRRYPDALFSALCRACGRRGRSGTGGPGGSRDPRHQPCRPRPFGLGLHEPQPFGNGGWLKANPIPADQSYWGSVQHPLRGEPRQAPRRPREGRREQLGRRRQRRTQDRRLLGELHGRGRDRSRRGQTDPGRARRASRRSRRPPICRARSRACRCWAPTRSSASRRSRTASTSTEVIAIASQGGLGLPDRDYYTKTDDESKKLRDQYVAHVAKMFELLGDAADEGRGGREDRLAFETRLAEASMTPVERRDPEKTYNRMDAAELAALTPNFSWTAYFQAVGLRPGGRQRRAAEVLRGRQQGAPATPLSDWKTYLRWHSDRLGRADALEGRSSTRTSTSTERRSRARRRTRPAGSAASSRRTRRSGRRSASPT